MTLDDTGWSGRSQKPQTSAHVAVRFQTRMATGTQKPLIHACIHERIADGSGRWSKREDEAPAGSTSVKRPQRDGLTRRRAKHRQPGGDADDASGSVSSKGSCKNKLIYS